MKILNLYAGIGGNRKLWGNDHDITAIEYNKDIANIYQKYYPNDKVIVTDAHEYLLKHYKEFDFIWSSPPCPSHSELKRNSIKGGIVSTEYPEMTLYQQIILLKHFAKCKWVIENVVPYYDYLIEPNIVLGRHPFWCNFYLDYTDFIDKRKHKHISSVSVIYGYDLSKYNINNKRKILRNLVNPEIGKYILDQALGLKNPTQISLFD